MRASFSSTADIVFPEIAGNLEAAALPSTVPVVLMAGGVPANHSSYPVLFLDESGDCGMKGQRKSAPLFTLAAVMFETVELAQACEGIIAGVRISSGLPANYEFHFARIPHAERTAFLEAVAPCPFLYTVCTLDKHTLQRQEWHEKEYLYREVTRQVVSNFEDYLLSAREWKAKPLNAKGTADDNQDPVYFRVLNEEFRRIKDANGRSLVDKVKPGNSRTSSLLQLADMICGAVVHSHDATNDYRRLIQQREVGVVLIREGGKRK
jgi:hypothetical protein